MNAVSSIVALIALLFATASHAQPPAQQRNRPPARVASWQMPVVEGANLHYKTLESKAAGEKVSYLIYLPSAYEQKKDARFPVIYWLHGIGGSQQGVPRLCEGFTAAIAKGKMPPAIVVFANGMIDSFYCDAINAARPVETVIVKELIPHIDATYRTAAARESRMIDGFSMGGYGAAHLGFKYPELFGAVSMIDAALVGLEMMKTRHTEIFQRVFDGKDANAIAAHPLTLVEKNAAAIKGRMLIRQVVTKIVEPNRALHEKMSGLDIAHDYVELPGIGHNMPAAYDGLGDRNWEFYAKAFSPGAKSSHAK